MRKIQIYIVDDHPLFRRGLIELINTEADMIVSGETSDFTSALQITTQSPPDLIIVDISLNGENGIELVKMIQKVAPNVQTLVLSMHDENIYALPVLRAGAKGYITKEATGLRVVEAIRKIYQGKIFVSDHVAGLMLKQFTQTGNIASPSAERLSARELEIVNLIGDGCSCRQIADQLGVSIKTIESHRARIKQKLNLKNAPKLSQFCINWVQKDLKSA